MQTHNHHTHLWVPGQAVQIWLRTPPVCSLWFLQTRPHWSASLAEQNKLEGKFRALGWRSSCVYGVIRFVKKKRKGKKAKKNKHAPNSSGQALCSSERFPLCYLFLRSLLKSTRLYLSKYSKWEARADTMQRFVCGKTGELEKKRNKTCVLWTSPGWHRSRSARPSFSQTLWWSRSHPAVGLQRQTDKDERRKENLREDEGRGFELSLFSCEMTVQTPTVLFLTNQKVSVRVVEAPGAREKSSECNQRLRCCVIQCMWACIHLLRDADTHLSTIEVLQVYMWMPIPLRDLASPAPQTVCRPCSRQMHNLQSTHGGCLLEINT